ncbi:MAG: hypothetical protein ACI835_005054 [Planctomycetota bacterium]|jgi:hypothetical protein
MIVNQKIRSPSLMLGPVHASLGGSDLMTERNVLEDDLAAVLGHKLEQADDQSKVGHARMIITTD